MVKTVDQLRFDHRPVALFGGIVNCRLSGLLVVCNTISLYLFIFNFE